MDLETSYRDLILHYTEDQNGRICFYLVRALEGFWTLPRQRINSVTQNTNENMSCPSYKIIDTRMTTVIHLQDIVAPPGLSMPVDRDTREKWVSYRDFVTTPNVLLDPSLKPDDFKQCLPLLLAKVHTPDAVLF